MHQLQLNKAQDIIGGEIYLTHSSRRARGFCMDDDVKVESTVSDGDTSEMDLQADESKGEHYNRGIRNDESFAAPKDSNSSFVREFREPDGYVSNNRARR